MQNYAEPWGSDEVVSDNESFIRLSSKTGGIVARLWLDVDDERFNDEQRAYARRIVACVNACSGYSTEQLEDAPVGGILNGVAGIIASRDKLLEERSQTGMAIDAAIRDGVVPEQHPLRSRLEMLANHRQREQELLEALKDAREMVSDWGSYASDYFKEKHNLAGDLASIDAAVAGTKTK